MPNLNGSSALAAVVAGKRSRWAIQRLFFVEAPAEKGGGRDEGEIW
jgi:hypothetical protein